MTLLKQSFETATLGGAISTTNPSGDNVFNAVNIAGAAGIIDNTHASQGVQSLKFTPVSGSVDSARWTGLGSSAFAVSFYMWIDTLPTAETFFCNITTSGGTRVILLELSNSGKFRVIDTTGTSTPVWTATNNFPTGQWVRVECYATLAAGTATINAAYYLGDSTTAVDFKNVTNGNTGATAADTAVFGKGDSGTYASAFWLDGLQFQTAASALIGPYPATAASTVRPTTDISNAGGFSIGGGSGSISIALADESDTTFAQSPDNPTGSAAEVKFGLLQSGLVTVKVRHLATASSPALTRTYNLKQGSTVISTRSVVLPTTATDYSFTTTSTEAGNITDRSDLRLYWSDTI